MAAAYWGRKTPRLLEVPGKNNNRISQVTGKWHKISYACLALTHIIAGLGPGTASPRKSTPLQPECSFMRNIFFRREAQKLDRPTWISFHNIESLLQVAY